MTALSEIHISPQNCVLNGTPLSTHETGKDLLKELYRNLQTDYPKFFKMDGLCRLGFIASEVLLAHREEERFIPREDRAVILVTHQGCLTTDYHYEGTIKPGEGYFPSPAIFVYTLPNIVTGEIAIRNKYMGETSMYVTEAEDASRINELLEEVFMDTITTSALIGWVDYRSDNDYIAHIKLISKH